MDKPAINTDKVSYTLPNEHWKDEGYMPKLCKHCEGKGYIETIVPDGDYEIMYRNPCSKCNPPKDGRYWTNGKR